MFQNKTYEIKGTEREREREREREFSRQRIKWDQKKDISRFISVMKPWQHKDQPSSRSNVFSCRI